MQSAGEFAVDSTLLSFAWSGSAPAGGGGGRGKGVRAGLSRDDEEPRHRRLQLWGAFYMLTIIRFSEEKVRKYKMPAAKSFRSSSHHHPTQAKTPLHVSHNSTVLTREIRLWGR